MRVGVALTVAIVLFAGGGTVLAQERLSLEDVLQRVRSRAPEVLAAVATVDEARARLLGAGLRFRNNPSVEIEGGPRDTALGHSWDVSIGVGQTFETGGQRLARVAMAEADVARSAASADDVARLVVREVALAYVRALAATERRALLLTASAEADELRAASERRFALGDIAAIDVNLTRIAAARAAAEVLQAEAQQADALRPLRIALGLAADTPLTLTGTLDRAPAARPLLDAAIEQAPALRRATAAMAEADADAQLGRAARRPDIGARAGVRREGDDRIVSGGVSFALPFFDRGQAHSAEAVARRRRLVLERDAARRALEGEVFAGLQVFEIRRRAVATLRDTALAAADDNAGLATRSLAAGEISLMNVLLIRQDVTATRLAYVDAAAEAALAAIDVDATAGVLR